MAKYIELSANINLNLSSLLGGNQSATTPNEVEKTKPESKNE